jgi:hypothetical protein
MDSGVDIDVVVKVTLSGPLGSQCPLLGPLTVTKQNGQSMSLVPQHQGTILLYNTCKPLQFRTRNVDQVWAGDIDTKLWEPISSSVEIVTRHRRLGETYCLHFQSGRNLPPSR